MTCVIRGTVTDVSALVTNEISVETRVSKIHHITRHQQDSSWFFIAVVACCVGPTYMLVAKMALRRPVDWLWNTLACIWYGSVPYRGRKSMDCCRDLLFLDACCCCCCWSIISSANRMAWSISSPDGKKQRISPALVDSSLWIWRTVSTVFWI